MEGEDVLVLRADQHRVYVCTAYRERVYPEGCGHYHEGVSAGIHAGPGWRYHEGPRRWWWSRDRLTFDEALDKARDFLRRMDEVKAVLADANEVERLLRELK
jgi:hypothetical protein